MLALARIFGFVVTAAIVAFGLWRLDLSQVGGALAKADYRGVVPSAIATLLSYALRTARWQQILAPSLGTGHKVTVRRLYAPLMIGFMANNILPARMGEFVRAYAVGRSEGVPKSLALGTIVLERVFDGLTLVAILAALALLGALPALGGAIGFLAGGLFVVAALGAWLLITNEALAVALLRALTRPFPDTVGDFAQRKAQSFVLGLRSLRRPRRLAAIGLLSAAVWLCEAASYYFLILGFGSALGDIASEPAALFLTVVVNLGVMIPSAPGYVGTFEGAAVSALAPYRVTPEVALALAIVSHAIQWVIVTAIGAALLIRSGFSLRGLQTADSS